jgi:hypothetical protein
MVNTTLIARVTDGLPLAASMDDEEVRAGIMTNGWCFFLLLLVSWLFPKLILVGRM